MDFLTTVTRYTKEQAGEPFTHIAYQSTLTEYDMWVMWINSHVLDTNRKRSRLQAIRFSTVDPKGTPAFCSCTIEQVASYLEEFGVDPKLVQDEARLLGWE